MTMSPDVRARDIVRELLREALADNQVFKVEGRGRDFDVIGIHRFVVESAEKALATAVEKERLIGAMLLDVTTILGEILETRRDQLGDLPSFQRAMETIAHLKKVFGNA